MHQGVDLSVLMAAIHEFFMGLGVDEIRRRGSADDKPLRMVKTLLHELCKQEVSVAGASQSADESCMPAALDYYSDWPSLMYMVCDK